MTRTPHTPAQPEAPDLRPVPQFYIPATASLLERRPRTLKQGDTFAVFDHYGDLLGGPDNPEGLYHCDTRHLAQLALRIDGARPLLLSSVVRDDNAMMTADLTNPDLAGSEGPRLAKDRLHITRSKLLWQGCCYERIGLRNYALEPVSVRLEIAFAAGFEDLFEVRGMQRPRRGAQAATVGHDRVVLSYDGLDGLRRETCLQFTPAPHSLCEASAGYEIALPPGGRTAVYLCIACGSRAAETGTERAFFRGLRAARRSLRTASARAAAVSGSHEVFNELMRRAIADISVLVTDTAEGPYPYAGIPWFSTAFGRDGIITALLMLWADPAIACGVLRYLARTQAQAADPAADAQPGKILHETRQGEMARLGEVPFARYYGSVDATPLFVLLAGQYYRRTGDLATIAELWPSIAAALDWIDRDGDADRDGFVEYARRGESGLDNQGWKDSEDSVFHADGTLARPPIALCEVQGYVYAAKIEASKLAHALRRYAVGFRLEAEADALRTRVEADFWCDAHGFYALALDGKKVPCRVRSSNAGHLLFAGLPSPGRGLAVGQALAGRDFFSGWGVRTLASEAVRYNPMSYHNGSVWPHDNALIALGLARYGLKREVLRIFQGVFAAASYLEPRRLPELFCGFPRARGTGPTLYPVACAPQAWASATPFGLLAACLGLECDALAGEIRLDHPVLPPELERVTLRNIVLGESRVDLDLYGHGGDVTVRVARRDGDARVLVVQ